MRSLLHAFHRDHHHLMALVGATRQALEDGGDASALDALARRLRRHLRIEEEVLFGAVDRVVQDPRYPITATLRREHDVLRELLADCEHALAAGNRAGAAGNLRELEVSLRLHEHKEAQVLYPMAEHALGNDPQAIALLLDEAAR